MLLDCADVDPRIIRKAALPRSISDDAVDDVDVDGIRAVEVREREREVELDFQTRYFDGYSLSRASLVCKCLIVIVAVELLFLFFFTADILFLSLLR